jgi:hypothetical protein
MVEQRQSTKHGPLRDELLKKEAELLERGAEEPRAQESRVHETLRDEDARPTAPADDFHATGGTPPGMDPSDVRGRSELARRLQPSAFPADRDRLLASTEETAAPDWIVEALRALPAGRRYHNVQEVWLAMGGGTEDVRHRS